MNSLYLHIPYCQRKCGYCDFFSLPQASTAELDEYVQLLLCELEQLRQQAEPLPLQTIFFGGGTPSLLSVEQVASLLRRVEDLFGFSPDCEVSLEANPGTLSAEKLHGYRQAGINRLSLGVQTLNDDYLRLLGRAHSAAEAREAVVSAREAGFENLSLDLIFALPGQSLVQLTEDVEGLLAIQPEHLSLYGLTFESGTQLYQRLQAGELAEVDEQVYADSYLLINRLLTAAGFEHYEISNFARPGYRCRHNQVYWQRRSCFALGCGAHSFNADGWGERWHVPADLLRYRRKLAAGESPMVSLESFDRQAAMAETIYLALRTADGLSREQFKASFGCYPEEVFPGAFQRHAEHLQLSADRWSFDLQGWLLYDHLISSFL